MKEKKPMKIIFKNSKKPTGLARIGYGFNIKIHHKGKQIGIISGGHAHGRSGITIQLGVKVPSNPNCPWSWVMIQNDCQTEEEAKALVLSMIDDFAKNNDIHYFEKF